MTRITAVVVTLLSLTLTPEVQSAPQAQGLPSQYLLFWCQLFLPLLPLIPMVIELCILISAVFEFSVSYCNSCFY